MKHRCLHATIWKALQLKDWIVMKNATINWNVRVDWSTKLSKNMALLFKNFFESILHVELVARWAASKRWLISLFVKTPIFVAWWFEYKLWWHWWHVALKMKALPWGWMEALFPTHSDFFLWHSPQGWVDALPLTRSDFLSWYSPRGWVDALPLTRFDFFIMA